MVSAWVVRVDLALALAAPVATRWAAPDLAVVRVVDLVVMAADEAVPVEVDGADLVVMVAAVAVPVVADLAARAAAGLADLVVVDLEEDAADPEVPAVLEAVAQMAPLRLAIARDVDEARSGWPASTTTSPTQR
jgi:hypothetical protein